MERLKNAKIAVVGLGGVGSHTAHMLARAGVGHLRLIDFDQVSLSSLNRHACATLADVGTPKVTCMKKFCQQLCPDERYMVVEDIARMYTADEKGPELLEGHEWDLVIDAIDDIPTKAALIGHCVKKNIRVISCMGAGGKSDMTRLHVADLRTASRDPLATKLRQSLKREFRGKGTDMSFLEDTDKVAIVYSSEKTVVQLADFTDEQKAEGVHQYGAVDGMRIRIIPVLGTMPAIMGQSLAALALCDVSGKPFSPVAGERLGKNFRHKVWQHLKRREVRFQALTEKNAGIESTLTTQPDPKNASDAHQEVRVIGDTWVGPPQIDTDDVEYVFEIWRNRCAVTGDRLGTVLELTRWDYTKPSDCQNLVIMCTKALKKFDEEGIKSVPDKVRAVIEKRLSRSRVDRFA